MNVCAGLIVEVLNLLIVLGVPMDEHADANEQIVGFAHRNHARRDTVGDSLGDAMLSRAEHLHGLGRILDRHLVEQDGCGLDEQIWRHHREQCGETILVIGQRIRKRRFRRAAARSDDEVDVILSGCREKVAKTSSGEVSPLNPSRFHTVCNNSSLYQYLRH